MGWSRRRSLYGSSPRKRERENELEVFRVVKSLQLLSNKHSRPVCQPPQGSLCWQGGQTVPCDSHHTRGRLSQRSSPTLPM